MPENDANDRQDGGQENTFTYTVSQDGRLTVDGADMGKEFGGPASTRFEGQSKMELEVRPGERKAFTEAELIQALQESDKAKGRLEYAEPLVALAERNPEALREFLEWRNERIADGIDEPPPAHEVNEKDVLGYRKRSQEPEFERIRDAMREYASTLPPWQAERLASNHWEFNHMYDRFKSEYFHTLPEGEKMRSIQNKEVLKDSARVEHPGGPMPEEPSEDIKARTRITQVRSRLNQRISSGEREKLEHELALHYSRGEK